MDCRDCAFWNTELSRCSTGKVNPPDWETAVNVANVLGLRSICMFNDYRERLIAARGLQVPSPAAAKSEPETP